MSVQTERISHHFTRSEFRCKGKSCCGGSAPIDPFLVINLERLRALAGKPLKVNSGFRCLVHNRTVGSNDSSQHTVGRAADLRPPDGMTPGELAALAERIPAFRGIGIYDTFVHVDVRPGPISRWDYRSK